MNTTYTLILSFLFAVVIPTVSFGQVPATNDSLVFSRTDSMRQVTVTASRNAIQVENGRIVMNVANSALNTGASAFDLLKKLPGISVSQEDNISLRGSGHVVVLIDGKMNYLSGKQLADFLKGVGADNVVKIELITTPGAEFDAAGNAAIINIITRKRSIRGYAIDLRSTVTRASTWMINENISASLNSKRIDLFGSFDYNTPNRQVKSTSGNEVQEHGNVFRIERNNTGLYKIKFYTYRLGIDWRIGDRQQLSAHYHGYFDDFTVSKDATVNRYDGSHQLHSVLTTQNNIIEPYHYNAANVAWTYNIDTTGKKLTAEGHYIRYRNLSDALMTSITTESSTGAVTAENALRSHQPGYITIRSAKTDLEWPASAYIIKAGLKYAYISNDNNYRFDSLRSGLFEEATSMSNHFIYNEKISAAYLSASRKFNRTSVLAGVRVEQTSAKGFTKKGDFSNNWEYTTLFPNVSIDHELKKHKLNFSVSRRINRPTYSDLNPVRWYTDQYFYYSGNPGLQPELAWLLSLTGSIKRKYNVTATYGFRDNYLTKLLVIDSAANAVKSQTANFSNMQRLDVIFSAPFSAGPWSMQATAAVNYAHYPFSQEGGDATASRWAANVQVQQQLKLPANFKLEVATFFYSRELWGIYLKDKLFYTDAGLRKSFLKDNLIMQLSFTDVFRTYRLRGASLANTTNYRYNDRPDAHRISFSVRYHLGGKLVPKRGSQIEEQDRL